MFKGLTCIGGSDESLCFNFSQSNISNNENLKIKHESHICCVCETLDTFAIPSTV